MSVDKKLLQDLEYISLELKKDVIVMLDEAGTGHIGGAFSIADVVTCLYFYIAKVDPQNPRWNDRDYVLLSNGHVCPILYTALARRGFFSHSELSKLRKIDSLLQGHPKLGIPGIENTSGLLGQGISQGVGIALGLKMDSRQNTVCVLSSDGEHQEGQIWEAVMSANKWGLDNLVVVVDRNQVQIDGSTEDIMPIGSLKEKYEGFGWLVMEIDGHNYQEIITALEFAKKAPQPVSIIAHTISGEGISFMEGLYSYHDWKDNPEDVTKALAELDTKLQKLRDRKL